ncbi:MAG: DUF2225 domain-containing protein [Lachnospiraceae bacterium]|nr:DUF2225 domain-containing protein [Lachnospiraceae bacterium]
MGLFSGLEILGFKNEDMKVYEAKSEETVQDEKEEAKVNQSIVKEEECLFPKTHECPVCYEKFKSLAVRAGKLHSVGTDDDLRPLYRGMDPIKYDAIVCPHCGYAALSRYFDRMMPHQGKILRAEVKSKFKGMDVSNDLYSYDEALLRYKMVLMCDVIGGVKVSRRAYSCLKLGWVIRGKLESEGAMLTQEQCDELRAEELECIQHAYEGYVKALSSEPFPMSGMDEQTVLCLVAELAYKLEKYREALLLISQIVSKKDAAPRIKERALTLKEKIREHVKGENS